MVTGVGNKERLEKRGERGQGGGLIKGESANCLHVERAVAFFIQH